ncbi:hypothetical protein HUN08_04105 [Gordonia sp. X0973]|uniref:hypothetical protein n=1 Tax=Gordonia sp. X0973 TaxID=2742602 RepID=UPI000F543450|nr:hypothetical protein [Gordonia sp. X0973]QKT06461.1 hypothetical protein HUN08_04105 [Gordonia sp. X0973]
MSGWGDPAVWITILGTAGATAAASRAVAGFDQYAKDFDRAVSLLPEDSAMRQEWCRIEALSEADRLTRKQRQPLLGFMLILFGTVSIGAGGVMLLSAPHFTLPYSLVGPIAGIAAAFAGTMVAGYGGWVFASGYWPGGRRLPARSPLVTEIERFRAEHIEPFTTFPGSEDRGDHGDAAGDPPRPEVPA